MGKRGRSKRKAGAVDPVAEAEDGALAAASDAGVGDQAQPLLALHPQQHFAGLALGTALRVYDTRSEKLASLPEAEQLGCIRCLAFSDCGTMLLAGGDDKVLRVWRTDGWRLVLKTSAPKKISAAAFARDATHVIFADKFGDIHAAPIPTPGTLMEADTTAYAASGQLPAQQKPALLGGHYAAIVSDVAVTPDGRLFATADREAKLRVSVLPREPMQGYAEIRSFCLGHTAFVTCCTFVAVGDETLLVTASGDGTIRNALLWAPLSGACLDVLDTTPLLGDIVEAVNELAANKGGTATEETSPSEPNPVPLPEGNGMGCDAAADGAENGREGNGDSSEEDEAEQGNEQGDGKCSFRSLQWTGLPPAVLFLAASRDGRTIAAGMESSRLVLFLQLSGRRLTLHQILTLESGCYPTSAAFDGEGRLWLAASSSLSGGGARLAVCALPASSEDPDSPEYAVQELPHKLREALEIAVRVSHDSVTHPASSASRVATQHLRKRVYQLEEQQPRCLKSKTAVADHSAA